MLPRWSSELSKAGFIPMCCAIARPHLEYAMEASSLNIRSTIDHLERVQRLVRGLRRVPYKERLRQVNLFSLERRRLRFDLKVTFKIFTGLIDLSPPRIGMGGHTYGILQGPSRLRPRSSRASVHVVPERIFGAFGHVSVCL